MFEYPVETLTIVVGFNTILLIVSFVNKLVQILTRPQSSLSLLILVSLRNTGRQKEEDGKTLVCDERDRAITDVFCGDLH